MGFSNGLAKANLLMEPGFFALTLPGRSAKSADIAHPTGIASTPTHKVVREPCRARRLPSLCHERGWLPADGAQDEADTVASRMVP